MLSAALTCRVTAQVLSARSGEGWSHRTYRANKPLVSPSLQHEQLRGRPQPRQVQRRSSEFWIVKCKFSRSINHPNLKLQLDLFHLQQIEGNLTRNIEKYLPYVGHIQVAQVWLQDSAAAGGATVVNVGTHDNASGALTQRVAGS